MSLNYSGNAGGNGSGDNNGGGSGVGINWGSPCGACKFLRRKCLPECIFAPYFSSDQGTTNFAMVHKVFGASNVSKLLQNIPVYRRQDAVSTLSYEAQTRLRDPVYGCVAHIFILQQQVMSLQAELSYLQGHLAQLEATRQLHPPPPPQTPVAPPAFSIGDQQPPSTMAWSMPMPTINDLSSTFEPMAQTSWAIDPHQHSASGPSATTSGDDLQALAHELLLRNGTLPAPPNPILPCSSNASSSPSFPK